MKRTAVWAFVIGASGLLLAAGCDRPPGPPKTADGEVIDVLTVDPSSQAEVSAVTALETARVEYAYRLDVLQGYYYRIGNMDKYRWTEREQKNLRQAHMLEWTGIPEILPPEGESLTDASEPVLVEYVVELRQDYLAGLDELAEFYFARDPDSYKGRRVRNVMERFDPIRTYMYFLEAEVPPADLEPVEVIPQADALFAEAKKLYERGRIVPLVIDYEKERRALGTFRELIRLYPRSTKIARSAYLIAEIYKEYFNENLRAVKWYERAWQWDPDLPKPARFQAATVCDIRLHNRLRAIELYREAIEHEQFNSSNVTYARRRIEELTGESP